MGQRVLPELARDLPQVSRIRISDADGVLTLDRAGNGWVLREKGGYPVRTDAVRRLVAELSDLMLLGKQREAPARLASLADAAGAPVASGRSIVFARADGSAVTGVVLGTRDYAAQGAVSVRRLDAPQLWLARGDVHLPTNAGAWLDTALYRLEPDQISRVLLQDGRSAVALNMQRGKLTPLDKGQAVETRDADEILALVTQPNFDDVMRTEAAALRRSGRSLTVETAEGLQIRIEPSRREDGSTWALVSARALKPQARALAGDINARAQAYAFRLRDAQAESLARLMAVYRLGT